MAVGSQTWKLVYYRDPHIFQIQRSYPQILGTRKVTINESKNDSRALDWPLNLTVTWHFLPHAHEMIHIFFVSGVKKNAKLIWKLRCHSTKCSHLSKQITTWICLVQALVYTVVLNGTTEYTCMCRLKQHHLHISGVMFNWKMSRHSGYYTLHSSHVTWNLKYYPTKFCF
jgi:hypothetical protein